MAPSLQFDAGNPVQQNQLRADTSQLPTYTIIQADGLYPVGPGSDCACIVPNPSHHRMTLLNKNFSPQIQVILIP